MYICIYIYIYIHTHFNLFIYIKSTLPKFSQVRWWWFSRYVLSDSCDPTECSLPASLSLRFSRQKYLGGLPFPSPGDLPNAGIEPTSPGLQADSLRLSHQGRQNVNSTGRLQAIF